jgi:hypothetical protein
MPATILILVARPLQLWRLNEARAVLQTARNRVEDGNGETRFIFITWARGSGLKCCLLCT